MRNFLRKMGLVETDGCKERRLWWILAGFVAVSSLYLVLTADSAMENYNGLSFALILPLTAVLLLLLLYLGWLGVLSCLFYHAVPGASDEDLPGCTVIVPAYNEGPHVSETLDSLLACDYPAEKLQIIAINDGSADDTWDWIEKSALASGGRIDTINLTQNGGKKHALYIGMRMAKHEIVATVDSDSILKKTALRNLVSPFSNPKIGAVAGTISAKNPDGSFISAMLDVTLIFGCEYLRAAQSVTGCVFCTPGALSAYRKQAIMPILDEWLNQKFFGIPAKIGEDRAIATLVLRSGYEIVHQGNAIAETCVPNTYKRLCKMLIRWNRSDIRENFQMTSFVIGKLKEHNTKSIVFFLHYLALMSSVFVPFFLLPLFLYMLLAGAPNPLSFLLMNLLVALLWSVIPAMIYAHKTSKLQMIWAFIYGVYCPFALSWILIYSFFTMRNSQWLTRDLAVQGHKSKLIFKMPSWLIARIAVLRNWRKLLWR